MSEQDVITLKITTEQFDALKAFLSILVDVFDESNLITEEDESENDTSEGRYRIVWQNISYWCDAYIVREWGIELYQDGNAYTKIQSDSYSITDFQPDISLEKFLEDKAACEKERSNKDCF